MPHHSFLYRALLVCFWIAVSMRLTDRLGAEGPREATHTSAEVKLRCIAVDWLVELKNRAENLRVAQDVMERLTEGEDFATLALRYSSDWSARKGGLWGWLAVSDLREELADAIEEGAIGRPSEIVELLDGQKGGRFFILMAEDRRFPGETKSRRKRFSTALEENSAVEVKAVLAEDPGLVNQPWMLSSGTALHFAVQHCTPAVVKSLLLAGADVGAVDQVLGRTPLHCLLAFPWQPGAGPTVYDVTGPEDVAHLTADVRAVVEKLQRGELPFPEGAQTNWPVTARILIEHGANPNGLDKLRCTPLITAAMARNREACRLLLEHGALVDATGRNEISALNMAARLGDAKIVNLLLRHGADLTLTDNQGYSAFHTAAEHGHDVIVERCLDQAMDVDGTVQDGRAARHLAAQSGHHAVAQILLERGANTGLADDNGALPIHFAAARGQGDVVALLLRHGASVSARTRSGGTALHLAIDGAKRMGVRDSNLGPRGTTADYEQTVTALLSAGADANEQDSGGTPPLSCAAECVGDTLVRVLIDAGASATAIDARQQTALHCAAAAGNMHAVKMLISHGADVDAKGTSSCTPLLMAARLQRAPMLAFLLLQGVDPDAKDDFGTSALHFASLAGDTNSTRSLILAGCDVNIATTIGITPLHLAAMMGQPSVISQLLAAGADIHVETSDGRTPLLACMPASQEVQQLMASLGFPASENARNREGTAASREEAVHLLLAAGADSQVTSDFGHTALHGAAFRGAAPVVRTLLQHGADPLAQDRSGFTPLHYACDRGHPQAVAVLLEETPVDVREKLNSTPLHLAAQTCYQNPSNMTKIVRMLLTGGADPEAVMRGGLTPLHRAAERSRVDTAMVLIAYGADVNARDQHMESPLHVASAMGHEDMIALLIKRGASVDSQNRAGKTATDLAGTRHRHSCELRKSVTQRKKTEGLK